MIKSQSSGIFEELDALNDNRKTLEDEIAEITKALEAKYAEQDQLNRQIESKEIEIEAIKSNFNHEFNKISFKKNHYEESLRDFNEQNIKYDSMIKDYQEKEIKVQGKIEQFNKQILDFETDANNFRNNSYEIEAEIKTKENLIKKETDISDQLYSLTKQINYLIKTKDHNIEEIQNSDVSSKRLESDIFSIDLRAPTLEEEKKSFVGLKNFKEAGRVSNELKQLNENKTKAVEKIIENKEKIENLKLSIDKVKNI